MNNFGGTSTVNLFLSGVPEDFKPTILQSMMLDIPLYITALIIFMLMLRSNSKKCA